MDEIFQFKRVQPDVRAILEPYLDRYAWLIPAWCYRVFVRFEECEASGNDTTDVASTVINKTYRWASIRFHGGFLTDTEFERRMDTIHELLHISLTPAFEYAKQSIQDLSPANQTLGEHISRQIVALHEQGVQDLAHRIVMAEGKWQTIPKPKLQPASQ